MQLEENLYSLKLPEWQVWYALTDPKNVKGFSLLNLAAFSSRLFVQKSLASQGCYSLCWKDRICCYTVRNGTWIIFYAVKGVFCFIRFLQQTSYLKVTFIVAPTHQSHCFATPQISKILSSGWDELARRQMERMKKEESILQKDTLPPKTNSY